ncbi:hypothetical protein EDC96DRAFT_437306, partial [Choanephora cucurbitarum]
YRKWSKANWLNCLRFWISHQQFRARLHRLIRQRKCALWRQSCDSLAYGSYTKSISKLSKFCKSRTLKASFSTPEGSQQTANQMVSHLRLICRHVVHSL